MSYSLMGFSALPWPILLVILLVSVPLFLYARYFLDYYNIRSNGISGPVLSRFSDIWLGWVAAHGHRSEIVHELHKKYGKHKTQTLKAGKHLSNIFYISSVLSKLLRNQTAHFTYHPFHNKGKNQAVFA